MVRKFTAMAATFALFAAGVAHATPTIQVTPWLAPNAYGSPDWPTAEANAVQAMYQGVSSYGTPGTPGYFEAQSYVTAAEAIVTGFNSWRGQVDPGIVFGALFGPQYGSRMTFGLAAYGNGDKISISGLGFSATSTDPFNALGFAYGPGSYNYGTGYIGVLYGADGVLGGGDDTFITSGSSDQKVDAIFGRGSGNSFAAYCAGCSLADQQAAIDAVAAYLGTDFEFEGTYTLDGGSGSGTFHIAAVPEPGAASLAGLALCGLAYTRRRKAH